MQNSVVCDVGPFLKVGLLRWLLAPSPFGQGHRLGVIRYREPVDDGRSTGDVVRLAPTVADEDEDDLRSLDTDLYDRMRAMAAGTRRPLSAREVFRSLPPNTVCFDSALSFDGLVRDDPANRVVTRQRWFHEAMVAVTPCSLTFLDSDAGAVVAEDPLQLGSAGLDVDATIDEIGWLLDRGQSVVTHHLVESPSGPAELARSVEALMGAVHDVFHEGPSVVAYSEPTFVRLFTLIPHRRHRADLNARLGALQMSRWGDELRLLRWHPALVGI